MLRLLFRFIGLLSLAAAFAALVIDGARSLANSRLIVTSLAQTLNETAPVAYPAATAAIESFVPALLWRWASLWILDAPACVALCALGWGLMALTRRKRRAPSWERV